MEQRKETKVEHSTTAPIQITILGIDPGIANTGWSIVKWNGKEYEILDHGHIQTKPKTRLGKRLEIIGKETNIRLFMDHVDLISVEQVFFQRNASSAMNTAKVIGMIELIAYQYNNEFIQVRPQDVKTVIGCKPHDKKDKVIAKINKMFKIQLKNQHTADAIACAIAGHQAMEAQHENRQE